jgi:hypothetical protein
MFVRVTLLSSVALQASTLPAWPGSAPGLKSSSDPVAKVAAAGESAFNLTVSLDAAASIKFLVVHASVYARFGDNYAVYDNVVSREHDETTHVHVQSSSGVFVQQQLLLLMHSVLQWRPQMRGSSWVS